MPGRLAVDGGEPVRKEPWPQRVQMDEEELNAVISVIRDSMSGPIKLGRYSIPSRTEEFETEFAKFAGTRYAAASSSGTAAVHVALGSANFEPGSEVITSPITDPGSITPIIFQNLIPVFADVDPETLNVDPESVGERITDKTVGILPVHLAGSPCDMDPIIELAEERGLLVIEDCAQAHAATYKGKMVGSLGDLGCFSLMSGKHITSGGEGGMTVMDDTGLWERARSFADKGKSYWPEKKQFGFPSAFLGLNYRMTELQAAIGFVQLRKLPKVVETRRRLGKALAKSISNLETIRFQKIVEGAESSYWFIHFHVNLDMLTIGLDRYADALKMEGIPVSARYINTPIYEWPFITKRETFGKSQHPWSCIFYGRNIDYTNSCPKAKKALEEVLTVSLHECCTVKEVEDIALAMEKVERNYRKHA